MSIRAAITGFVLIVIGLLACRPTEPNANQKLQSALATNAAAFAENPSRSLVLESADSESGEFGVRYVIGTIRNKSTHTFGYAQVSINLYDDSGAQVGSTIDNVNNLAPDGVWKFRAVIADDRATKFKVTAITGF